MDYLNEIAKYTNWEYQYIDGAIEELLDSMMRGEIDLMGGALYNSSLEEYFAYPK